MLKKSFVAAALLGAFAGTSLAEVTLYGRVDAGLLMTNVEQKTYEDGIKTEANETTWGLESGIGTSSRIGFKGIEQINNNLTVGFVLEQGFTVDTGTYADSNRAFNREASLFVKTDYGTVYAGRLPSIWSDDGSTGFWATNYLAFGTGGGVATGAGLFVNHNRADNRVTYISPSVGGVTLYADYSFGDVEDETAPENTSRQRRPAAIGLNFENGAFATGLVVTHVNEVSTIGDDTFNPEDEITVSLGTSYDFGVAKVMLAGQYFNHADAVSAFNDYPWSLGATHDDFEGYAVALSATIPAWGGMWLVGGSFGEFSANDIEVGKCEFRGYEVAATYYYPLSRQFQVYAGAGLDNTRSKVGASSLKQEHVVTRVMAGMTYFF